MKNSFVLYTNYIKQIEALSFEQAGVLLVALMRHVSGNELPEMDGMTYMAFLFISEQIDRDLDKYHETVNAHKECGKRGGRPKKQEKAEKPNGYIENQMVSKKPNGFYENQTKHDNDNDNVNENDIKEKSSDEDKKKAPAETIPEPLTQFEEFWAHYPNSGSQPVPAKRRTEHAYASASLCGFSEQDLIAAAKNYAEAVRIEERDTRYIKKPENFLSDGTYKDYLPDVYVKPEAIRKKTAADRYNAGIMSRNNIDFDALEKELLERSEKNAEGIL